MFGKKDKENKKTGNQSEAPAVDYSNIMPGAMPDANLDLEDDGAASAQQAMSLSNTQLSPDIAAPQTDEVVLPEEAYVITEKRGKVARPVKNYRYTIINSMGKKENGTFDAESETDVRNFLLAQDYQVIAVTERSKYDIDIGGAGKIKAADLAFSLTQLSTYLRAGIPLVDSVRILAKQSTNPNEKKAYQRIVYDLLKGENFSVALQKQEKKFSKLLY